MSHRAMSGVPGTRLRALLCLAAALACSAPAGAGARGGDKRPADDVVGRVNGQAILRRDFELAVQIHFAGRRPANVRLTELQAVREKVLDKLIDSELLHQSAVKSSVAVPEADVDAELKRMQQHVGTPGDFAKLLGENQVTEAEFREQLRRSLRVRRFVDREVVGAVAVTDEEVKRYYDQNPNEMKLPERVRVSQIMVRAPAGASSQARAEGRERIEEILKALRAGADFADLARKHSDGPEAKRGGDSGFLLRGGGAPPAIEEAAFRLKPGETSDVLETRLGYHIIRVGEHRTEGPTPFEDAKKTIVAKLTAQQREEKIHAYVAALREKARIERRLPAPAAPKPTPSGARVGA